MWTLMMAVVAVACVLASIRRLAWAVSPTWVDAQLILSALEGRRRADWVNLRDAIAKCEGAIWERDLFTALTARDERWRTALMDEQLRELDWRAKRWASVPRVCARVATSAGFLFACLALVNGLGQAAGDGATWLGSALNAFAIGIAGMAFCVAVHLRSARALGERLAATGRLVERLEAIAAAHSEPSLQNPEGATANAKFH